MQNVFHRYEKKYLLTKDQYRRLRKELEPYMREDEYGLHTVRNIYFDTEDDRLIRRSIEKPVFKEKFRVRCYGKPSRDAEIFLEIKKKYQGIVSKRRAVMRAEQVSAYFERGQYPKEQSQILREIDYFREFYQIRPKVYLAYDRIALLGREDAEFRVTFDQNIRSRWEHLDLADDTGTIPLLERDTYLMEVKTLHALPLWFVEILSRLGIRSTSFSKYGRIYQERQLELRQEMKQETGREEKGAA